LKKIIQPEKNLHALRFFRFLLRQLGLLVRERVPVANGIAVSVPDRSAFEHPLLTLCHFLSLGLKDGIRQATAQSCNCEATTQLQGQNPGE
jgi:hypothetical protein